MSKKKQFPLTYRRLNRFGGALYVSGWTHELTVGTLGSEVGFRSNNYGALDPQSIDSTVVNDLRVADTVGTVLELTFDGLARPRNPGTYEIEFVGFGPYTLTWNAFSSDYRVTTGEPDFVTFLLDNDGNTLGIRLE